MVSQCVIIFFAQKKIDTSFTTMQEFLPFASIFWLAILGFAEGTLFVFFLKVIKPSISPVDSPLGKSSSQQIHVLHHPLLPSIHIPPPTLEPLGPQ